MLLAVAVILGIVLLQQLGSGSDSSRISSAAKAEETTTSTRRPTLTIAPVVTTTSTIRARAKGDVKVVVANGAGERGLGAKTTATLKNLGYATLSPVDASPAAVDKTTIQFADGYEPEAREVAQALNQPPTVVAKLSSPQVAAADIGDAKVIVVLGADAASTATTTAPGGSTTTTTIRR